MPPDNNFLYTGKSFAKRSLMILKKKKLLATHTQALSASFKNEKWACVVMHSFQEFHQYPQLTHRYQMDSYRVAELGVWENAETQEGKKKKKSHLKENSEDICFYLNILGHLGCKSVGYSVNKSFLDLYESRIDSKTKEQKYMRKESSAANIHTFYSFSWPKSSPDFPVSHEQDLWSKVKGWRHKTYTWIKWKYLHLSTSFYSLWCLLGNIFKCLSDLGADLSR